MIMYVLIKREEGQQSIFSCMYVCMYVCICMWWMDIWRIQLCICMHACMYSHVWCMCVCMYMHVMDGCMTYTQICRTLGACMHVIHIYACMHIHTYICMYVCMYVCICVCMYAEEQGSTAIPVCSLPWSKRWWWSITSMMGHPPVHHPSSPIKEKRNLLPKDQILLGSTAESWALITTTDTWSIGLKWSSSSILLAPWSLSICPR